MTPSPFSFRLVSYDGTATDWLPYLHIDFRGRLVRITLAGACSVPLHRGEEVSFEACLVKAQMIFDSLRGDTLFLLVKDDPSASPDLLRKQLRNSDQPV